MLIRSDHLIYILFQSFTDISPFNITERGGALRKLINCIDLLWKAVFYPKCLCLQCQNYPSFQVPTPSPVLFQHFVNKLLFTGFLTTIKPLVILPFMLRLLRLQGLEALSSPGSLSSSSLHSPVSGLSLSLRFCWEWQVTLYPPARFEVQTQHPYLCLFIKHLKCVP